MSNKPTPKPMVFIGRARLVLISITWELYRVRQSAILLYIDLSDPTRAVTGALDGAVLAALASAGIPLTVGQLAERAARGSEIGIRRSLVRLTSQGIVRTTLMGRNQVHELNREHIAAGIAVAMASLRNELWARFREDLGRWRICPLYASVFGSAARGDGDESSDIDLLLVHPPFPGEPKPRRLTAGLISAISDALGEFATSSMVDDAETQWQSQVDALRQKVEGWTGNPLQVVDLSFRDWRHPAESSNSLLSEVAGEGVELIRSPRVSVGPVGRSASA